MTHPFENTLNEIEAGLEGVTPGKWEANFRDRLSGRVTMRETTIRCHPANMAELCRLARLGIEAEMARVSHHKCSTAIVADAEARMTEYLQARDAAEARIAALEAENAGMREALMQCAQWFQDYAAGHLNKGDFEKAKRNQDRADHARAALGDSHE